MHQVTAEPRPLRARLLASRPRLLGARRAAAFMAVLRGLLLIVVLGLAASYGMNVWYRVIFDALQSRESGTVLSLSLLYLPLLAGSVLVSVMQLCLRMSMQRRWRAWLNHRLLDRWLRDGRYYQLDLVGGAHRNPEGRIADDARIATEAPVDFAIGLTTAVLSAATFIVVLWTVGGAVTVEIAGAAVTVPGFLVVAAAIYAVLASGTMFLIGRRSDRRVRAQEPGRGGVPLRAHPPARERRKHRLARRRGRGAPRRRKILPRGVSCVARCLPPEHAHDRGLADQRLYRADPADHPVRAKIPRRRAHARRGDAGGVGVRARAICAQLDGRQLSAARRVDRLRAARRRARRVARRARARGSRRAPAGSSAAITRTPRCGCATSRSCARTARRSSPAPSSRSCRASSCCSPAPPAPARARWCARSRARGRGAAAGSRSVPARSYSCCRSGPTCRPARCAGS